MTQSLWCPDAGGPKRVLGADDVRRATTRIAHEIVERNRGLDGVVLVGLRAAGSGSPSGSAAEIERIERDGAGRGDRRLPLPRRHRPAPGHARPDAASSRSTSTARPSCSSTTCCSPAAPCGPPSTRSPSYGRPRAVQLAVLVDRGHRELPIRPDFVGKNLPTASTRTSASAASRRRRHAVELWSPTRRRTAMGDRIVKHLRSISELGRSTPCTGCSTSPTHGRGQPAPEPEGAGAARQDGVQPVLRGLDPDPAVVRDGGQAAVGRRDDVQRRHVERQQGREPARHDRDGRRDGRRRVRHPPQGERRAVADRRAGPTASIVNGGDGWHAHPTQALLDAYTVRGALGRTDGLDGVHIAIVGDIRHSRVARSDVEVFAAARRRRHARRAPPRCCRRCSPAADRPTTSTPWSRRSTCSTCCGCSGSGCTRPLVPVAAGVQHPLRADGRAGRAPAASTRW